MAQCQAQTKKHGTSHFDLYGDIFCGHLYGISGGSGKIDRLQSSSRYDTQGYSERRQSNGENISHASPVSGSSRDEGFKAGSRKPDSTDNFHSNGANSTGAAYYGGLAMRSTSGVSGQSAGSHAPDVPAAAPGGGKGSSPSGASKNSPLVKETGVSSSNITPLSGRNKISGEMPTPPSSGRNKNSGEMSTPPPSGRNRSGSGDFSTSAGGRMKNSGDLLSKEKNHAEAFGEIIKGVGKLNSCDDSLPTGGPKSGSDSGGRARAESPKSCGSNSSGGSSSGGSPTAGRIVNFGNILPSGGPLKIGNSPPVLSLGTARISTSAIPTAGAVMGQSRRSNSADFPSGNLKKPGGNGFDGVYTGGANPKGSKSTTTSPTGSVGTTNPSVLTSDGASGKPVRESSDSMLIRNAIANMDAEELKNAGNESYKKGLFAEALSLYDKAISLAPQKAPYRSNRAAALTGLGRLSEAMQECLHAIKLDSSYTRAHHRLASLYLRLGQLESAKRYFKTSGSHAEWADNQRVMIIEKHLLKCDRARKSQDWHSLMRETDAAIIAGADIAPQVMAYKAEALLKLHRPDDADAVLSSVRKVEDVLKRQSFAAINIHYLLVHAQIDLAIGRFEGAVLAAEKASKNAPYDNEVCAMLKKALAVAAARKLGNDLFKAGRWSEATQAYGEGLEADVANAVLLCNRAACRSKLGQWEKAVEDCNAALEAQPSYTKALMRRAKSLYMLERLEDAFRDYEELRREMPGDVEVRRGLFEVQVALKKSRGEDIFKMRFGGEVEQVSSNEQFQEAITSPGLSIVQFSTRWSERCRAIAPCVDNLCKRYLSLNFLKVDVDDLPYLAKVETVQFVPTFKIYKNGSKVLELCGPNEQALERAVMHYSL